MFNLLLLEDILKANTEEVIAEAETLGKAIGLKLYQIVLKSFPKYKVNVHQPSVVYIDFYQRIAN